MLTIAVQHAGIARRPGLIPPTRSFQRLIPVDAGSLFSRRGERKLKPSSCPAGLMWNHRHLGFAAGNPDRAHGLPRKHPDTDRARRLQLPLAALGALPRRWAPSPAHPAAPPRARRAPPASAAPALPPARSPHPAAALARRSRPERSRRRRGKRQERGRKRQHQRRCASPPAPI